MFCFQEILVAVPRFYVLLGIDRTTSFVTSVISSSLVELAMSIFYVKYFARVVKAVKRYSSSTVSPAENSLTILEQKEQEQVFLISQRMYED